MGSNKCNLLRGRTASLSGETLLETEFTTAGEIPLGKFRFEEKLTAGETTEKPVPMLGAVDVVEKERVVVVVVVDEEPDSLTS